MSSRLAVEVRERLGLVYDIYSYAEQYFDTGAFIISAGVDDAHLGGALDAIWEQVDRIRQEKLPAEEMDKVREFMKGRLLLSMEDSWNVASWYGSQEVLMHTTITLTKCSLQSMPLPPMTFCAWRNESSFPAGRTWRS